jgi:hypothetical protein
VKAGLDQWCSRGALATVALPGAPRRTHRSQRARPGVGRGDLSRPDLTPVSAGGRHEFAGFLNCFDVEQDRRVPVDCEEIQEDHQDRCRADRQSSTPPKIQLNVGLPIPC